MTAPAMATERLAAGAPAPRHRVLVVAPNLRHGGAQRIVATLSAEWARQGHEVTVAVFDDHGAHYAVAGELISLARPARPGMLAKAAGVWARTRDLAALIRAQAPDRIVSFMESANYPTTLACAQVGRLADLTVSVRDNPASFPRAFRRSLPIVYRWPGRVVAISAGVAQALVEMGVPAARIETITNPLDVEAIAADARAPLPAAVAGAGPFVLAAGRLVPQKGFDLLIAAFAAIAGEVPERLVIMGEGPERARLEAQARAAGLGDRVLLPGRLANPFPCMAHARAFVLSSRHEGWGNVLAEALAVGCPAVAFDCPYGPAELIGGPEHGVLVPPGDVAALADALLGLLADPERQAALRAAGPRRCAAFAPALSARRWLDDPER